MTEQQFLRQIKRLLHCKADKKREILRQLESDIASAKEGGKSWEEISDAVIDSSEGRKRRSGEHRSSLLVNLTKMGGT